MKPSYRPEPGPPPRQPQKLRKRTPAGSIHSKIPKIVLGGLGARSLLGGSGRAFSLEVASFAPTYKFSEAPEALRARFFARLGRFGAQTCSPEPPWDAPGLDFRVQNNSFVRRLSVRRTFGAQNIQHQKNTVKTNTKCTSELPRIDRKSLQNRSGSACDCVWRRERPCERLESCPGGTWSVSGMPRRAFGQLLTALGSSGATQDRLWGSIWVSKNRPEHVQTRPRNRFGRPRRPEMDFLGDLGAMRRGFCRFPNAFSSIFFRAVCDEATKSESQKRVV